MYRWWRHHRMHDALGRMHVESCAYLVRYQFYLRMIFTTGRIRDAQILNLIVPKRGHGVQPSRNSLIFSDLILFFFLDHKMYCPWPVAVIAVILWTNWEISHSISYCDAPPIRQNVKHIKLNTYCYTGLYIKSTFIIERLCGAISFTIYIYCFLHSWCHIYVPFIFPDSSHDMILPGLHKKVLAFHAIPLESLTFFWLLYVPGNNPGELGQRYALDFSVPRLWY